MSDDPAEPRRISIENPVGSAVWEESFLSPADGTRQTYLAVKLGNPASTCDPLLVVYLHGGLNHQEQGMTAGIYDNYFGRKAEYLKQRSAIYLCPEYRGNSWMGPAAEADLVAILQAAKSRWHPTRTILTGGSMGGTSALIFATRHPEMLDGVWAWCPATDTAELYNFVTINIVGLKSLADEMAQNYGGTPEQVPSVYRERSSRYHAEALAKLPVVLVHGVADDVISIQHSRFLAQELKRCGARLHYVEIPGGDHGAPCAVDVTACFNFLLEN